ncbi:hypothetical protein AN944_00171 [Shewanella sp. P1-14-1]|nr:hypothetical protein AN944_00171 [Shewanella sp. P1-14-1]
MLGNAQRLHMLIKPALRLTKKREYDNHQGSS